MYSGLETRKAEGLFGITIGFADVEVNSPTPRRAKIQDEHLVVGKLTIVIYPRKNLTFWGISPEI